MKILANIRIGFEKIMRKLGYAVVFTNIKASSCDDAIRINIGAGDWGCAGWTNLDYPSEWYKQAQSKHDFIPYNIREDSLPFADNSVKLIYCCHVVEHIENCYIEKLFQECYRVLQPGGVARFVCPDAEFLYDVSKFSNDYWKWRYSLISKEKIKTCEPVDFLVQEIATPHAHEMGWNEVEYKSEFKKMDRDDFFDFITNNLEFEVEHVGDHINWWTFGKFDRLMKKCGFATVIRSKYMGSVSGEMKNPYYFDVTHPQMSLYVEAVK